MILLPNDKAVFISTPKAATRTLYHVLTSALYGGDPIYGIDSHRVDVPPYMAGLWRFGIVRNPYSRAVSLWWSTTQREGDRYGCRAACGGGHISFDRFCKMLATRSHRPTDYLFMPQVERLRGVTLNCTMRYETINTDFHGLPFWRGPTGGLPLRNVSERPGSWRGYMTDEAASAIRAWAGPDFDSYDYPYDWRYGHGVAS